MITILIFLLLFFNIPCVYAENKQTYFARVMFDQVYLYKSPTVDDSINNIYFELPKTYFVELTESATNDFYKANYLNFTGFVKKSSVQAVDSIPNNPYLQNATFRVYADLSRQLKSEPNNSSLSSNQVAVIPNLTRNITYFGKIIGESLIEGRTNVWYYCKYSADKDYYGYVYSDFCDELTEIVDNTENLTYINNPTFEEEKNTNSMPTNSNFVAIIVCILSIPAIIFAFMVLKGKNILSTPNKNKEIIDY